jgi:hypothetical protein
VKQSSRQPCDACRYQEKTRDEIRFLGDIEPGKFPEMTEEQQQATLGECFGYDDHLRANGYLAAGEGPAETALTLYWKNGKLADHSAYLPAPGGEVWRWEIRPAADLSDMVKQSEQRRRKRTAE